MTWRLDGKRMLITGAGTGIGRESAQACAQEGARVLATDIDIRGLALLAAESSGIEIARLDVTDNAAVDRLVASRGPFDALLNCAGYLHQGSILACDEASWRRSFAINVDAMYFACKAVLPGMLGRGRGSIINISSVVSSIKGMPHRFADGGRLGDPKEVAALVVHLASDESSFTTGQTHVIDGGWSN